MTLNLASDIVYGIRSIDHVDNCTGGFSLELIEKKVANNSSLFFKPILSNKGRKRDFR